MSEKEILTNEPRSAGLSANFYLNVLPIIIVLGVLAAAVLAYLVG